MPVPNKYLALDQKKLRRLIDYDPLCGKFVWKISESNRAKVGSEAGTVPKIGRRVIRIGTYNYYASNLAWLYVHGRWPAGDIDHRDLNKSNDKIDNLREATRSQNNANIRRRSNNTSGFKGVSKLGHRRFRAYISVNKKQTHIGVFETAELAHLAYWAKAKEVYGEFARGE